MIPHLLGTLDGARSGNEAEYSEEYELSESFQLFTNSINAEQHDDAPDLTPNSHLNSHSLPREHPSRKQVHPNQVSQTENPAREVSPVQSTQFHHTDLNLTSTPHLVRSITTPTYAYYSRSGPIWNPPELGFSPQNSQRNSNPFRYSAFRTGHLPRSMSPEGATDTPGIDILINHPTILSAEGQNMFPSFEAQSGSATPNRSLSATDNSSGAVDQSKRFSDSRSADSCEEDEHIFKADIPRFPMPPSMQSGVISPPPNIPCPPLPADYTPAVRRGIPKKVSLTELSGEPTASGSGLNMTSTVDVKGKGKIKPIDHGESEEGSSSNPYNYVNKTQRLSTTSSDPFELEREYNRCLPLETVKDEPPHEIVSSPEALAEIPVPYNVTATGSTVIEHEGSDIGNHLVSGKDKGKAPVRNRIEDESTLVNEWIATVGSASDYIRPGLEMGTSRIVTGPSEGTSSDAANPSPSTTLVSAVDGYNDPDLISIIPSDSSEDKTDFGKFKSRAQAAAKLTNTCAPDERLSQVVASSSFQRVAIQARNKDKYMNTSFIWKEGQLFLNKRHKARLERTLGIGSTPEPKDDEPELGASSQVKKQRISVWLNNRKLVWGCFGVLVSLGFLLMVLMLFVAYPAGVQKALDMSEFKLNHLAITDPTTTTFDLGLDLIIDNKAKLSGKLEPMLAELTTEKNPLTPEGLSRRMTRFIRRADLFQSNLQQLDMPTISFSDHKQTTFVQVHQNDNHADKWGVLLAKVFGREESAAIGFEGTGLFKKGPMRMKMHLKKSISLIQMPVDNIMHRRMTGIVDWRLESDTINRKTLSVKLSGRSQFPNPSNLTIYLGDCTFDLLHRNVVIGALQVLDYHLVPGLNTDVNFTATLDLEALDLDLDLRGSFLSTLMLWDPTWVTDNTDNFRFQIIGKMATINGTEIPWLTKAVQGIKDTIYMLSNSENGTTDVSNLVSEFKFREFHIQFSDMQTHEDQSLSTKMLGGWLTVKVRYPVSGADFGMDMMYTTHVLEFIAVKAETHTTYARIDVTDFDRTTSWSGTVEGPNGRMSTGKELMVDLNEATLTIFDPEAFAEHFLRPQMNGVGSRVVVKGQVVMAVDTPIGRCTLEPIVYAKSIMIDGMLILETDNTTLVLDNIVVTKGSRGSVNKYPKLEMIYDLSIRTFGDEIFGFGNMVFDMMQGENIIGTTRVSNLTISPGLNKYRGVMEVYPYGADNTDSYFNVPILNNLISGKTTGFVLAGATEPLGVDLGPPVLNNHRGFPSEIMGPRREILDSIRLMVNEDLKPISISLGVMNPLHTKMAITFFEGNITATHLGEIDLELEELNELPPRKADRRLATITREQIARFEIPPSNGTLTKKTDLPNIPVNPLFMSYLTKDDILNPALDIIVHANLGIDIGGFTALVPYVALGRKESYTPEEKGGFFKLIFVGGVTVHEVFKKYKNVM